MFHCVCPIVRITRGTHAFRSLLFSSLLFLFHSRILVFFLSRSMTEYTSSYYLILLTDVHITWSRLTENSIERKRHSQKLPLVSLVRVISCKRGRNFRGNKKRKKEKKRGKGKTISLVVYMIHNLTSHRILSSRRTIDRIDFRIAKSSRNILPSIPFPCLCNDEAPSSPIVLGVSTVYMFRRFF